MVCLDSRDLAIPTNGVKRAPGTEIENGDIPIGIERKHRLPQQIGHDVVSGKAAHRTGELAGHDGRVSTLNVANCDIPGSKDILQVHGSHEPIDRKAAIAVARSSRRCR